LIILTDSVIEDIAAGVFMKEFWWSIVKVIFGYGDIKEDS
jgi:hypothetical protein